MKINVQIPALYYTALLAQSKRKAQALLMYCTTIATGYKPSSRNLADLIGLSKSQAALWIIDFKKAIEEENRTVSGHSKSPISGTLKPQNNYISNDKSDSNRTVSSQTVDTQDGSNSGESDVSSHSLDSSHVGTRVSCKRSPLKGRSSTGARDSLGSGKKLKEIRDFQAEVRVMQAKINGRLKIEMNGNIISFDDRHLIVVDGQIAKKNIALGVWNELFMQKDSLLRAFLFVQSAPVVNHFFFKNGELFLINNGEAA